MALTVTSEMEDEIAVLTLVGNLTLGPHLRQVREAVSRVLATNRPRGMVVDASRLVAVDSAGLGELTIVYSLTAKQGCPVFLSGAPPNLTAALEMTHLDALLPAATNVLEARRLIARRAAGSV